MAMPRTKLETFLRDSVIARSQLWNYKKIRVVLGNETCDLDSAVCTLVQGLIEYSNVEKYTRTDCTVIPVMNIPLKDFRLKTEVTYYLNAHNVSFEFLTFRDQIDLHSLQNDKKLELILVDHHVLASNDIALTQAVVKIYDHRPLDVTSSWPKEILNIDTVGSCATLITRNCIENNIKIDNQISNLLQGPILVDTYNMSTYGGRVTYADAHYLNVLECINSCKFNRTNTFNKIIKAKMDISQLTFEELMLKDLKIVNGIPIPVLPILVESFLAQEHVIEAIEKFAIDRNCTDIILIGLCINNEYVTKDIAIFSMSHSQMRSKIMVALGSESYLKLKHITRMKDKTYILDLFRLENLKVTRKYILPIIQKVTSLYLNPKANDN